VLAKAIHAEVRQVVERGTESDRGGDVGGTRLELPRHVVERRPPQVHLADHLAAREERRHRVEQLAARPQRAGPGRAEHLVAREDVEVGTERLDVDGQVRDGLCPVDEHQRSGGVRHLDHLAHRVDGADAIGDVRERDELRAGAQQHLVRLEVEPAVVVDGHELEVASFSWTSSCHGTRFA
jgi:hypothetical protein